MSVEWEQQYNGAIYRVIRFGNTVRLYRNYVLHSQWNFKQPVSGKLWDLFLISALGLNKNLSRVLVLGAGGGSVINLIHHFYPDAHIHAIDFDKTHLNVAKKYFKINAKKCVLIHADAEAWLLSNNQRYDLIIDDVFSETDNIPYRSIDSKKHWVTLLSKHLGANGILVFNFADNAEWKKNYKLWQASLVEKNIAIATHHKCDNKIVHISNEEISLTNIKPNIQQHRDYLKYIRRRIFSYRMYRRSVES